MIRHNFAKSCHTILALAALSLGPWACLRPVPPEAIPPRLLYFEPTASDTLVLGEEDAQVFTIYAQAGEDAAYSAWLGGSEQEAAAGSFHFAPAEFGLVWPELRADSLLDVTLRVEDGGHRLEKSWPVRVAVTLGMEIILTPDEFQLETVVNDTLRFNMSVRNVEPPYYFNYRLDNGANVSSDSSYVFVPRLPGQVIVSGHIWKPGIFDRNFNWTVDVEPCSDVVPPPVIDDLRIGPGPIPGDLDVVFTPPEDEELFRYELRVWHLPLDVEQWESTDLLGQPLANPDALEEHFTFTQLDPGRFVYARMRSFDYCGNASEWSELAPGKVAGHTVAGRVTDWETGLPLPGLEVRYGIGDPLDMVTDTTDVLGAFECRDVPEMGASETNPPGTVRDENGPDIGLLYDILDTRAIDDSLHHEHGTFGHSSTMTGAYPTFLGFLRHMLVTEAWDGFVLRTHYPIRVLVEPFTENGVDYAQLLRNAMAIWEEDTGLDLFAEADGADDATLFIEYDTSGGYSFYRVGVRDPSTLIPLEGIIHWVANGAPGGEQSLQRVILHELGHALGPFEHSAETGHVMATTNATDRPSADEIKLIRILYHMQPRQDLDPLAEQ